MSLQQTDVVLYMVERLSVFYRGVLGNGKNLVPIETELGTVKSYLDILKIRYDNLEYQLHADPEVLRCDCVKMSIQPLVENCIVHGFKGLGRIWKIRVNAFKRENKIFLEVIDNGIGLTEGSDTIFGFGFTSVDKRIKMYFGSDYGVRLIPGRFRGTKIQVVLPYKEKVNYV